MVDQLERAEVAEEKRAVFRALTRLRGAAITSFDGIARSQTGSTKTANRDGLVSMTVRSSCLVSTLKN